MIILDTDVVSEPMKPAGDPSVIAWMDRQRAETLYITTPTLAELLSGIERLSAGRRRIRPADILEHLEARLFAARILPFDDDAARAYAVLTALARAVGRPMGIADAQIAAIPSVRGFAVATRDTAPFQAAGVPVIDPWTA